MKLSPEERQQHREMFARMTLKDKLEHIWLYYKMPIFLAIVAVSIVVSGIHRAVTQKEPVLYAGFLNVAVGSELETVLSADYLNSRNYDPQKAEILFYRDLYLSNTPSPENHEYAYTSNLKILATVNSKTLDVVLMNREAYDICSGSGYLLDLRELISLEDPRYSPYVAENLVILEDNSIEYNLGEASEYLVVTESIPNALNLSTLPLFAQAGFSGEVYLGIIANTPRLSECEAYFAFLIE